MFALFSENGLCGNEIILRAGNANQIAADLLDKNDLMFVAEYCKSSGNKNNQIEVKKVLNFVSKSKADMIEKSDIENFSFELSNGNFKFLKCAETEQEVIDFAEYIIELKNDENNHILFSNEEIIQLSERIKESTHNEEIYNCLCNEISQEQYL